MLFLPFPIVVALLLLTVLLILHERFISTVSGKTFGLLLMLHCLQLIAVGVHWGYAVSALLPIQALLAAIWCPLAWVAFRSLSRDGAVWQWPQDRVHLVPVCLVLLGILFWRDSIDVVLLLTCFTYAALLVRLAMRGADSLSMVRLHLVRMCYWALWATAMLIIAFALIDIFIIADVVLNQGKSAPLIVTIATVPSLFAVGIAAVIAGQGRSIDTSGSNKTEKKPVDEDAADRTEAEALLKLLEQKLVEESLYKDSELNLQRLAEECGLPARKVSKAINICLSQNVSQWVNQQRIDAACEWLKGSNKSISWVMYEVGFTTKSNFNREFKRITGSSPSQWRQNNGDSND